ncbi:MAG: hypothetical protein IPK99_15595 [Flavobacteriales bacterium]|nr:hypothetical protein [Flavobacteriales bacterium]
MGNTLPTVNVSLIANVTNGNFTFIHPMESFSGSFLVTTYCNGLAESVTLPYVVDSLQPNGTVLYADLNCGNEDCLGVVGGSAYGCPLR